MNKKYGALAGLTASLLLSACGGGGGDSGSTGTPVSTTPTNPAPAPVTTSAEGVYQGSTANGLTQFSLVLETGDLYVLYGKTVNSIFGVSGFLRGSGASSNGAFTASGIREFAPGNTGITYALNGTYTAGSSLNGTLTGGAASTTFTGAALTNTTYVYTTAAKLSDVAGAWTLYDLAGAKVSLNIGADGKFTGTSGGCAVTGSLAPRASGKNVFDFTLLNGAAPCALPGQTASGEALYFTIGAQHQLIAAGTDASRANGTAIIGAR